MNKPAGSSGKQLIELSCANAALSGESIMITVNTSTDGSWVDEYTHNVKQLETSPVAANRNTLLGTGI
jgi:hypothetical protein